MVTNKTLSFFEVILCVVVYCSGVNAETTPYQCPAGYPSGECHLTNMELISLPKRLPLNTTKLHAEDNAIKHLPYGAFQYLHFFKELYLENNLISEVTRYIFYGATRLEHINLAHCVIKHIDIQAFCDTPKLAHLDLQHNQLKVFSPAIFNCTKNLSKLLLNNNWLISLEAPNGYYHSNFWMMSLSGNPFICTVKMLWLQDQRQIGYIRNSDGKEQTPQCRNNPDVSFYDINLNPPEKEEGKVSVKTETSESTDEVNVPVGPEEPPTKPVQDKPTGHSSAETAWKTVAIVLMVMAGVSLIVFGIRFAFKKRRRNNYNNENTDSENANRDNTDEQDDATSTATAFTTL